MEVLIAIYPTLDSDLANRYHIKVLNYSKESTIIEFEGDAKNVKKARQEIEALISKFCVTEVSFEHPPLLLDSMKKRIKENGFKVNIKTPVVASRSNPICLTVSSFCPKQLDRATAILKGHPIYKSFRIPNYLSIDSAELKRIRSGICKECQVLIRPRNKQKTCKSLTICGFIKNDVIDAHSKLQEQLSSDGEAEVSAKPKPTPKVYEFRLSV